MTTPSATILAFCICRNVQCRIPFGFCHCGCGGKTSIQKGLDRCSGFLKGFPCRYLQGHGHGEKIYAIDALPFKIDGIYCRLIPLTRGLYTIVDAADYPLVGHLKWLALPNGGRYYAARRCWTEKGTYGVVWMHRLILGLDLSDLKVSDHINIDETLINTRANLRVATRRENLLNRGKRKDNTSGYKGIWRNHQRWGASVRVNGKNLYLGTRDTPQEAHLLYCEAARKHYGEFANDGTSKLA